MLNRSISESGCLPITVLDVDCKLRRLLMEDSFAEPAGSWLLDRVALCLPLSLVVPELSEESAAALYLFALPSNTIPRRILNDKRLRERKRVVSEVIREKDIICEYEHLQYKSNYYTQFPTGSRKGHESP